MRKSSALYKEKCNGRHPGCVTDISVRFPVICQHFSMYGGDSRKFKPIAKNGKCTSYLPDEKLIKALSHEQS